MEHYSRTLTPPRSSTGHSSLNSVHGLMLLLHVVLPVDMHWDSENATVKMLGVTSEMFQGLLFHQRISSAAT